MNWNLQAVADDARMRKLNATLPPIMTAILVGIAAWVAAALVWQVVETVTTRPSLPSAAAIESTSGNEEPRIDVQRIAELHLFGKADAVGQQAAVESIDAPETRLNLQLQGILAADGDGQGLAIIRSGKNEKVYAPGDSVAGGARVHSILADRVILRRSGQLETLRLPRLGADIDGIEMSDVPTPPTESSEQLVELRQQISQNPSALTEIVRYSPVMRDGELYGYRVYPNRDRTAFADAGLRPGDVVTAINGVPMNDPAKAINMMNSLQASDSISLSIERGGKSMSVSLNATH